MTTIIANIPARKITWAGKSKVYPARVDKFTQDEQGQWYGEGIGKMREADVIDVCSKATNWREIRAQHFPMEGF